MATIAHTVTEELSYFRKWVPVAVLIGIVSGVGAVVFNYLTHYMCEFFLEELAGYVPPSPGSETFFSIPENRVLLILPPIIGGLLSGLLVYKLAPEAEGHGTDAAVEAFHLKEGVIRSRVPLVKLLASAITIGSGGSAGKEGPVAQIGGGFGSILARLLKLSPHDRRIALAVGIGSGIGAVFKAPFGGAVFASEILYMMDFEPEVIPPAFIASFVGYLINCYVTGWKHVFETPRFDGATYKLYEPESLAFFALLGIVNGIVGILYVKAFYGVRDLFRKIGTTPIIKPAIGGLLTGLIGALYPQVLETSYGWLQMMLNGDFTHLPLSILLLLPLLKILATSFSIGSGGSGGVFAPALVIGGSLGALTWHFAKRALPGYDVPPVAFVVVGMMSFFGGVGKVPIATMLMVSEMTGEFALFAPSLIATTLSYIVTGPNTIYESQLRSRIESPAHGYSKVGLLMKLYDRLLEKEPELLRRIRASDLMARTVIRLRCSDKVRDVVGLIKANPYRTYPVVDSDNKFTGFVKVEDVLLMSLERPDVELSYLPMHKGVTVSENESLESVLKKMIENEVDKVAVVDSGGRLVGIVTAKEILRCMALARWVR